MVEIIINYGDSNKDQQSHHSFTILTVRNNPCLGDFTVKEDKKKKKMHREAEEFTQSQMKQTQPMSHITLVSSLFCHRDHSSTKMLL